MDKSTRKYLAQIGRKGGKARSLKKTLAVRFNGKKGGRPKKISLGNETKIK